VCVFHHDERDSRGDRDGPAYLRVAGQARADREHAAKLGGRQRRAQQRREEIRGSDADDCRQDMYGDEKGHASNITETSARPRSRSLRASIFAVDGIYLVDSAQVRRIDFRDYLKE
jgi:hypothetical protein